MTPLPCVWARVTCYGQVDTDGLGWAGCGAYDIAAPDRLTLKENVKRCKLCGSSNIEIHPTFCTGMTTQPMLKPTNPLQGEPGEHPKITEQRRRGTSLKGMLTIDRQTGVREANGRRKRHITAKRRYPSDRASAV